MPLSVTNSHNKHRTHRKVREHYKTKTLLVIKPLKTLTIITISFKASEQSVLSSINKKG